MVEIKSIPQCELDPDKRIPGVTCPPKWVAVATDISMYMSLGIVGLIIVVGGGLQVREWVRQGW